VRAVREGSARANAQERGVVLLVGVIRLGERAPESWRHDARALMLPWQRPYLRPVSTHDGK